MAPLHWLRTSLSFAALAWVPFGSYFELPVFGAMMVLLNTAMIGTLMPRRREHGIWMLATLFLGALTVPVWIGLQTGNFEAPADATWMGIDLRFGIAIYALTYVFVAWFSMNELGRSIRRVFWLVTSEGEDVLTRRDRSA